MNRLPLVAALLLLASDSAAQGGGPSLYEVGTPDMGLSAAGANVRARDAATAYTNPAGMALLEGAHVMLGAYGLLVIQDFELAPGGTVSEPAGSLDGGGRSVTLLPGVGIYTVHSKGPWRFGFSFNAPFAGGSDYEPTWVGRAFVIESQLVGVNLEPSLARRVSERLSVGLGLNLFWATLESQRAVSTMAGAPIATLDAEDLGLGFTLGAIFEADEHTRLGLTYRSPIGLDLEGELDVPGNPDATLSLTVPQGVSLGLRREFGAGFSLLSDVGWSDWSAFGRQRSEVAGASSTLDRRWHDTWRVGLGAELAFGTGWLLQAGLGYDSSAVEDNHLLPDIPFQESMRYSIGLQRRLGEAWTMGVSYTFMDRGHPGADGVSLPPGNTVVLDGEFAESKRHFLGLTLAWNG